MIVEKTMSIFKTDYDFNMIDSVDSSAKPDLVPLEATLKQHEYGYILTYQPHNVLHLLTN